jgi:hypothetical protein
MARVATETGSTFALERSLIYVVQNLAVAIAAIVLEIGKAVLDIDAAHFVHYGLRATMDMFAAIAVAAAVRQPSVIYFETTCDSAAEVLHDIRYHHVQFKVLAPFVGQTRLCWSDMRFVWI